MRIYLLTILLIALLAAANASAHELEGVWLFEKETNTRADGSPANLPAREYDGVLVYTHDGYVSATIMPRGRNWKLASARLADLMGSVGEGASTAYAGRYELDPTRKTVTHVPLVSVDPADVGARLARSYRVSGDKLLLSGKWRHDGEELTFTVHWVRAGAAAGAPGSGARP